MPTFRPGQEKFIVTYSGEIDWRILVFEIDGFFRTHYFRLSSIYLNTAHFEHFELAANRLRESTDQFHRHWYGPGRYAALLPLSSAPEFLIGMTPLRAQGKYSFCIGEGNKFPMIVVIEESWNG